MTHAETTRERSDQRQPEPGLDRRYGRIAISAVAAALPYSGECANADKMAGKDRQDA